MIFAIESLRSSPAPQSCASASPLLTRTAGLSISPNLSSLRSEPLNIPPSIGLAPVFSNSSELFLAPSEAEGCTLPNIYSLFSYSSALICTAQNHISFPFMRFRTLSQKHPGGGTTHTPFLVFPTSPLVTRLPAVASAKEGRSFTPSAFGKKSLSLLFPAHPKIAPVTRLESALPKLLGLKSFRIRTSRKVGGWARFLLTRNPKKDLSFTIRESALPAPSEVEGSDSLCNLPSIGILFSRRSNSPWPQQQP